MVSEHERRYRDFIEGKKARGPFLTESKPDIMREVTHEWFLSLKKGLERTEFVKNLEADVRETDLARRIGRTDDRFGLPGETPPTACNEADLQNRIAAKFGFGQNTLWAKKEALGSYGLLLTIIRELRQPRDRGVRSSAKGDAHAIDGQAVVKVCAALANLVAPCCWTAHYWDRRLNRARLLHCERLFFPHTQHGFVWTGDAPRAILFDEQEGPIYTAGSRLLRDFQHPGTFQKREEIETWWAIRLRWHRSRIALMLNWRRGIECHYKHEDLQLAVRYVIGWLTASDFDVCGELETRPDLEKWNVGQYLHPVVDCTNDQSSVGRKLKRALVAFLNPRQPGYRINVRWAKHSQGETKFPQSEFPESRTPDGPDYKVTTDRDELVLGSVCAQAAAFRCPLLIHDVGELILKHKAEHGTIRVAGNASRKWSDLGVYANGKTPASEIVVPIKYGKLVVGAANIEYDHPEPGTVQLHRAELLTRLFESVYALGMMAGKGLPSGWRDVYDDLLSPGDEAASSVELFRRFCAWVVSASAASVAYIVTYEGSSRSWVPLALRGRTEFLTDHMHRTSGRPGPKPDMDSVLKRMDRHVPSARETALRLCEESICQKLLPLRRGYTWEIFTTMQPEPIPNTRATQLRMAVPEPLRTWFESMLGIPLACAPDAQPDGVLWLGWESRSDVPGGAKESTDKKLLHIAQTIQPLLRIVAALYALYRYCDDDNVG